MQCLATLISSKVVVFSGYLTAIKFLFSHFVEIETYNDKNDQEPVVQSMISANPGLNFNLMFGFMHFCSKDRFKTLKNKSYIDPENICRKTCSTSKASS